MHQKNEDDLDRLNAKKRRAVISALKMIGWKGWPNGQNLAADRPAVIQKLGLIPPRMIR